MSKNVGASNSRNPKGLHGLYRDKFTFTFTHFVADNETEVTKWQDEFHFRLFLHDYYLSSMKIVQLAL
jgi:hypothetical protein